MKREISTDGNRRILKKTENGTAEAYQVERARIAITYPKKVTPGELLLPTFMRLTIVTSNGVLTRIIGLLMSCVLCFAGCTNAGTAISKDSSNSASTAAIYWLGTNGDGWRLRHAH